MTIGERIAAVNGKSTGFDWLRILLAVAILFWHTITTSLGAEAANAAWQSSLRFVSGLLLPMFFTLSGFLVAGSLERSHNIFSFLFLRAIRILPALSVEIVISAFVLGALVTTLPLGQYFSDAEFHRYFLNIVGSIQYELPGVFTANPYPDVVNAQLWTIPYEFECYAVIAALAVLGVYRRTSWTLAAAGLALAWFAAQFVMGAALPDRHLPGSALVVSFIAGVALFRARALIPWNRGLFLAALALSIAAGTQPGGLLLAILPIAYITVYLGLSNPPLPAVLRTGDYSYGLFLYHFAIQQFLVFTFDWARDPLLNGLASLTLTAAAAVCSWHFVEKPVSRLRVLTKRIDAWHDRTRAVAKPA